MKVHLLRNLPSEGWVSIEVYADRLAAGLRSLATPDWTFQEVVPLAVNPPLLRTPFLYFNRTIVYGLKARKLRGGINHVLDNSYGHLVNLLDARRSVVTLHAGPPRSWRVWNGTGPAMRFFERAFEGALRAARIIAVSEYSRRELLRDYAFDPSHLPVVHHGVDEHFRPVGEAAYRSVREQHLRSDEEGIILHVGHCAERKNVDGLLRAFALLLNGSDRPYRLLQIGGTWSPAQRALIDASGIDARVSQLSFVPNSQLPIYYSAANVFAFPSLYEGFGIPLIEAMACGTPVVCTDSELFHEVCHDAAIYADSTNATALATAIASALGDLTLARRQSALGLERSKLFSWRRCAEQTFAVYRELAEEQA